MHSWIPVQKGNCFLTQWTIYALHAGLQSVTIKELKTLSSMYLGQFIKY